MAWWSVALRTRRYACILLLISHALVVCGCSDSEVALSPLASIAPHVDISPCLPTCRLPTYQLTCQLPLERASDFLACRGPDATVLLCALVNSQVFVWHRDSGALLTTLQGHSATINSVCMCACPPCVSSMRLCVQSSMRMRLCVQHPTLSPTLSPT
jgi:hypothetical protein